jgi:hypothetical protein
MRDRVIQSMLDTVWNWTDVLDSLTTGRISCGGRVLDDGKDQAIFVAQKIIDENTHLLLAANVCPIPRKASTPPA